MARHCNFPWDEQTVIPWVCYVQWGTRLDTGWQALSPISGSGRISALLKTMAGNSTSRLRVAFRLCLPGLRVGRHPAHEDLIPQRQQGGADEHPQDSSGRHATQGTE